MMWASRATSLPGICESLLSVSKVNGSGRDFPNGKLPALLQEGTRIDNYVREIKSILQASASATLELATVVHSAKRDLDTTEFTALAERTGWSPATFSKLITIDQNRQMLSEYIDRLPSAWTVLYRLAQLSTEQLARFDHLRKLRPDTRIRDIEEFLALKEHVTNAPVAPALHSQREEDRTAFCELARIEVAEELAAEARDEIKQRLEEAIEGFPAHLSFREPRTIAVRRHRDTLRAVLTTELQLILSRYNAENASVDQYQLDRIENAAWQYQHKQQKGAFARAISFFYDFLRRRRVSSVQASMVSVE